MIFEYLQYRPYLESRLGPKGSRTGLRKKLSEHLQVHTTLVSQVLLDKADFSLEQAEGCNEFFSHSDDESEYFILLILKDRAGNQRLKQRFETKIRDLRSQYLNIGERLKAEAEILPEDRARFYSSYLYSALHVLVSIPHLQTASSLSHFLKLPEEEILTKLQFLIKLGLIIQKQNRFLHGPRHVHLPNNSVFISQHHTNWRLKALQSLEAPAKNDLHYSAAITLSQEDAFIVKDSIIQNLQENIKTIGSSKEEVAYVYNIDFFALS